PFHQLTRTFNLPSQGIEITLIEPHIVDRSECRVLTVNASDLSVLACFLHHPGRRQKFQKAMPPDMSSHENRSLCSTLHNHTLHGKQH
ncbi:hypothetical protein, partial [Citrobacter cronae]|uniref:hypothetical protein n=1 Tax=Citrobacter cronae TaxID=1748967 RepID=UPI0019571933